MSTRARGDVGSAKVAQVRAHAGDRVELAGVTTACATGAVGLRLSGLAVGYRGGPGRGRRRHRVVLDGLTLTASPGVVTMLLGPNGSGKSTLLRTVACLQPSLAGRIEVDGVDMMRMSPRTRARVLAVVLTERFDPGLLTGGDVVALGRHPHLGASGSLSPADRAAVAEALAVMHAEDLASQRVAELSDGQRQRIMVARALAQHPRLLVLDEPTAFLDAPARIELLERLRLIAAERDIAVVLSTHDVETALRAGGFAWLIGRKRAFASALTPGPAESRAMDGQSMRGLAAGAHRGDFGTTRTINSGPIDELAASGAINEAFDSEAVAFHATSGTFRLR